jgi:polyisoprenyl-phosphate glycosyltransferase
MNKNISLVIPCYNEEGNINKLIERCETFLKIDQAELVLVNNGSKDDTKKAILKHCSLNPKIKLVDIKKNIGFGYGVYKGLKNSKNEILAYTHADLQTDPNDVLRGLQLFKNENYFIKGNRIEKLKNKWSLFNIFISYSMTIYTSLLFRTYMSDIHAQPVIFHKKLLENIEFFPNDFMFDVWLFYKAKKKKYNIIRFPVIFNKNSRIYGDGNNDTFIKSLLGSLDHITGTIKLLFK